MSTIQLPTSFNLELRKGRELVVSITASQNSTVSHYAHAEVWRNGSLLESTNEVGYLYYCPACIAAKEANKLNLGIYFSPEDFTLCSCED